MSKRFVETERWKKAWFRKLGSQGRDIWNWLHDNCDSAGVWEIDFDRFSFDVGFEVDMEQVKKVFGRKLYDLGDNKVWLPKFLSFQYKSLNANNRAGLGILRRVLSLTRDLPHLDEETAELLSTFDALNRLSLEGQLTPQVKEEEKEQDKFLGESEGKFRLHAVTLEKIYDLYPRKVGKAKGLEKARKEVKTARDVTDLTAAVNHYRKHCEKEQTAAKFIKHFSTFMSEWRDWIDSSHGHAEDFSPTKSAADLSGIFKVGAG